MTKISESNLVVFKGRIVTLFYMKFTPLLCVYYFKHIQLYYWKLLHLQEHTWRFKIIFLNCLHLCLISLSYMWTIQYLFIQRKHNSHHIVILMDLGWALDDFCHIISTIVQTTNPFTFKCVILDMFYIYLNIKQYHSTKFENQLFI